MKLTRERITEGNEKLAKFIGWFQQEPMKDIWWETGDNANYVVYDTYNATYRNLPFHRDWNYLMKVVDKIGSIVYHREGDAPEWNWKDHYSLSELFTNIFVKWLRNHFEEHKGEFNLMNDLESIWCGCVAYVDWLENEKNNE